MSHSVIIRRYRPADSAFVSGLSSAAFEEYSHDATGRTAALIASPNTTTWIASSGERSVGFVTVHVHPPVAHVTAIAVDEAHRGRGVGHQLLAHAAAVAREGGASSLELVTSQANVAALDLFLRSGFRTDRRKTRYYERGQDAITLKRALP